jgi:hypothetical protein
LNKQLNDLKITWAAENANGNIQARDAAAAEAAKLRADFLKLAEGMSDLATQGLLLASDSVLAYHDIVADDGQSMTIAVNSKGTVFYEADFLHYDYYEQVHVESKAERTMGTLAKAAAGYYLGYLIGNKVAPNIPAVNHGAGVAGSWATDNYLPGVPDVGDTKTMIYRTNRDTGKIQHMVIDTNSYNLLKWKYFWETYK